MSRPKTLDRRRAATYKGKFVDRPASAAAPPPSTTSLKRKQPSAGGEAALNLDDLDLEESSFETDGEVGGPSGSSSEEEPFPELDAGSSRDDTDEVEDSEEQEQEEEEEEEEGDEAALLRELAEEQALEQDLAASDSGVTHSSLSDDSEGEGEDANMRSEVRLSRLIARNTTKPNEDLTPATSWDDEIERSRLLGFDTRDYRDRAQRTTSKITGEEKFVWEDIEPGYASDSEPDEVSPRNL
jgi:hypothetical protein